MNWRFAPAAEKLRFTISSPSHGSIPASLSCRIQLFQLGPFEDCFDGANIGSGPNQRFVGSFAEEQLERADDDRFARAGLPRDDGESRTELPFQILDQRQILDSEQGQNGGHGKKLRVES